MAGEWTVGPQTVTWTQTPTHGDGTNDQGGDPPALAYEPAAVDEAGNYTRSEWLTNTGIDRIDAGEAKFRITCEFSHFGEFDPLIHPGMIMAGHHHTFIGNKGTNESSDYNSLRANPASSCSGGPLNGTAYWAPTLFFESDHGIALPIKPNIVSFYYTLDYTLVERMYRILRGMTFIGGVDPTDRLNVARLAEIPDGQGWLKGGTHRYNGWTGWQLYDPNTATNVQPAVGNTADQVGSSVFVRQLVNADGSDPWGGAGEDPEMLLIANMNAPNAWDGHNLRSPNGRDHFRYPITHSENQAPTAYKIPDGWWEIPTFEVKEEFPNGMAGVSGHEFRSRLYLSSDRYGLIEANWHPRGSTFHFDWMNGWDSIVQETWQDKCTGTTQGANVGEPLTCGNSTISGSQRMLVTESSPDPSLSNDPVITFHNYAEEPAKDAFGAIPSGTRISNATLLG